MLPAFFSRRIPARRGFTMIELIVVIVILGVLAALAVPTFRKVIDTSKDKKAQVELAALAREAWALGAGEGATYAPENFVAAAADTASASAGPGISAASQRLRIIPASNNSEAYGDVSLGLPVSNTGTARLAMVTEADHCARVTMAGSGTSTSTITTTGVCRADGDDGAGTTFVPICTADCVGGAPPYPTIVLPASTVIADPWAPITGEAADPVVTSIAVPNEEDPTFGPTLDPGPVAPVPGAAGLGGLSSFASTHASPPHRLMVTDTEAGSVVVVKQNSATAGDSVAKTFATGIAGAKAIIEGPDPTVPIKAGKLTLGPFYVGSSASGGSVVRVDPVTRAVSAPVVTNLGAAPEALTGYACFTPGSATATAGPCLYAAAGDVVWKLSINSPSSVTKSVFATLPAGFAIKGLQASASGSTPTLTVAGATSTVTLAVSEAAGATVSAGTAVAGTTGGGGLGWVGANSATAHRGVWAAGGGTVARLGGGGSVALPGSKVTHYHGTPNLLHALDTTSLHWIDLAAGSKTVVWPPPPMGNLWVTGYGGSGQLGSGGFSSRTSYGQVAGITGVTAMDTGYENTMAVKADGTLWVTGSNWEGELGVGDKSARYSFTQPAGLPAVASVAAGGSHTVVRTTNGELWATGYNTSGQLGSGNTTPRTSYAQVTGVTDVAQVAVGNNYTMIVKTNGQLWATGQNGNGQLGLNDVLPRNVFTDTGMTDVAAVAGGKYHTVVLKTNGTLWSTGYNAAGQLGLGDALQRTVFTQVGTMADWAGVSANNGNDGFSLAVKTDGTVWSTGFNFNGALGTGNNTNSSSFIQAVGISGASSVSAGDVHSVVRKSDGTVWSTGAGGNGRLGMGDTLARNTFGVAPGVSGVTGVAGSVNHSVALVG